ncbi:MAG: outer membrane beta-barrel protein [Smithella sp.]|jgi:opacity protein-like surface antigen
MKGKTAVSVLLMFFVLCGSVYAQTAKPSATPDNYIVFKPGIFYPQGEIDKMGIGFSGEIAYGRRFHPNAALEIASGYIGTGANTTSGSARSISTGIIYPAEFKAELYAIPVTVAIKGIIPISKDFDVYMIAGGGGYYANAKLTYTVTGVGSDSASDNKWVLGGFLGAGLNFDIMKDVFVGLEGKYMWTDRIKMSGNIAGRAVEESFNLEGVQGVVTIGFRF